MKISEMSLEELELLSYTDLTVLILKEEKKAMPTAVLFKKICDLLDYSESTFEDKIGDYYTSLTIDKRFVLVGNEWDLRDNHSIEIVIDDEEEEEPEELEETEEEIEDDSIETAIDDEDLDLDDDMDDLSIVSEDELGEEE